MFEISKPTLYKAVIHSLNKDRENPEYSSMEVDRDDEKTYGLLEKSIEKLYLSREKRWGRFPKDSPHEIMMNHLEEHLDQFFDITKDLAFEMHKLLLENCDILPSCDVAFVLFEVEEIMYLACIKMNHVSYWVRALENTAEGGIAHLQRRTDLFMKMQFKVEEGFILHLKHLDFALLDKMYKIKGEKTGFFGDLLFGCSYGLSEKEKLVQFNQLNENIQDKFIGEDLDLKVDIKKAVVDTVMEEGDLDVTKILDKAFIDESELKGIYHEAFKRASLGGEKIPISDSVLKKKFETQKLTTDSGIEISIPVNYYKDKDRIEFKYHEDGSFSIEIKNIREFESN